MITEHSITIYRCSAIVKHIFLPSFIKLATSSFSFESSVVIVGLIVAGLIVTGLVVGFVTAAITKFNIKYFQFNIKFHS